MLDTEQPRSVRGLTPIERRRAIVDALKHDPARSDRTLVALLGVSRETVADVRRNLAGAGVIDLSAPVVGRDGKRYRIGSRARPRKGSLTRLWMRLRRINLALAAPGFRAEFRAAGGSEKRLVWNAVREMWRDVDELRREEA